IFGSKNIVRGNTINLPNSNGINCAGLDCKIESNQIYVDTDDNYASSDTNGIRLYRGVSPSGALETVERCVINNNYIDSRRSIWINDGNEVFVNNNILRGEIVISGSYKSNINIVGNVTEANYSGLWGVRLAISSGDVVNGDITIANNIYR